MKTNETQIKAGQILTARSAGDYDCVFEAVVIERRKSFAVVKIHDKIKRVKVHCDSYGEHIYALGKYSMCPIFRPAKTESTSDVSEYVLPLEAILAAAQLQAN